MLAVHRDIDAGTYQRDDIHARIFGESASARMTRAVRGAMADAERELEGQFAAVTGARRHG